MNAESDRVAAIPLLANSFSPAPFPAGKIRNDHPDHDLAATQSLLQSSSLRVDAALGMAE
jgi:hypothetical protein